MAYLEFEDNPLLEFEFFLADRLKMTVRDLRHTMPNEEFIYWYSYHRRLQVEQEHALK